MERVSRKQEGEQERDVNLTTGLITITHVERITKAMTKDGWILK